MLNGFTGLNRSEIEWMEWALDGIDILLIRLLNKQYDANGCRQLGRSTIHGPHNGQLKMKFSFIFTKMGCIHFNSCLSSFNATSQRLQLVCTGTNPDKQNANRIHTHTQFKCPKNNSNEKTTQQNNEMNKLYGSSFGCVGWKKSWFLWLTEIIHHPFIYECPDIRGTNSHA